MGQRLAQEVGEQARRPAELLLGQEALTRPGLGERQPAGARRPARPVAPQPELPLAARVLARPGPAGRQPAWAELRARAVAPPPERPLAERVLAAPGPAGRQLAGAELRARPVEPQLELLPVERGLARPGQPERQLAGTGLRGRPGAPQTERMQAGPEPAGQQWAERVLLALAAAFRLRVEAGQVLQRRGRVGVAPSKALQAAPPVSQAPPLLAPLAWFQAAEGPVGRRALRAVRAAALRA